MRCWERGSAALPQGLQCCAVLAPITSRARRTCGCVACLPTHGSSAPSSLPFCAAAEDPLVGSIAKQYMEDRELHDKTAAEWTKRYAQG